MAITLREFIRIRVGTGQPRGRILTMFLRAFTAPTFAAFWHYWNPVYGYLLARFVYRPSRSILPRPPAVILTFLCSGFFLHDLPLIWLPRFLQGLPMPRPLFAVWFFIISLGLIAFESLGYSMRQHPPNIRILAHSTFLLACLSCGYYVLTIL